MTATLTPAVRAYLEMALWSSTDDDGEPLDRNHAVEDIAPEALTRAAADLAAFYAGLPADVQATYTAEDLAHDFWLTRNGHGAGFWDGDYPQPAADILTDAAEVWGSVDLYIGDDGLIYMG